MGKIVRNGASENISVKGKTVKGVSVAMWLEATAAATALSNVDYNWQAVTLQVNLKRGGQTYPVFSGSLDVAQQISNYKRGGYFGSSYSNQAAPPFGSEFTTTGILVAPAGGIKGLYLIPIDFIFGVIQLRGDDELKIDLNVGNAFINNSNSTTSYFLLGEIECTGIEKGIPQVKVEPVQEGQPQLQINLGDNCDDVYFVNVDKKTIKNADAVISSVTFVSNRLNYTKNYYELLSMRSNQTTHEYADQLAQTFCLAHEYDLDQVSLNLTLNSANVSAGKNFLVSVNSHYDPASIGLHQARTTERQATWQLKKGFGGPTMKNVISSTQATKEALLRLRKG